MTWRKADQVRSAVMDQFLCEMSVVGAQQRARAHYSLDSGFAGNVFGLYAVSRARGDASLIEQALRYVPHLISDLQFAPPTPEAGLKPHQNSLLHSDLGVWYTIAHIAAAAGDSRLSERAVRECLKATRRSAISDDLVLGRAGVLIALIALSKIVPAPIADELEERIASVCALLNKYSVNASTPFALLNDVTFSHGLSGILYVLFLASRERGHLVPHAATQIAECIAGLGRKARGGRRWPIKADNTESTDTLAASWCNGSAGIAYFASEAYRVCGPVKLHAAAVDAAFFAGQNVSFTGTMSLCCGLTGRSFALARLGKITGEQKWNLRSLELADVIALRVRASNLTSQSVPGLYKGLAGAAVLFAELAAGTANLPLFEI